MSNNGKKDDGPTPERRRLLKEAMLGGIVGAALLPERWARPVVEAVVVPAHAQTSPGQTTTTTTAAPVTTTTTTAAPVTTTTTTAAPVTTTTTTTPALSDIRLKRDIEWVARLENGIDLYRYRYLWSDVEYVGVMAQKVAPVMPEAVISGHDGYLRVQYDRLGLRLMTWEQWLASTHEQSSQVVN
jgi:hypothetical protein